MNGQRCWQPIHLSLSFSKTFLVVVFFFFSSIVRLLHRRSSSSTWQYLRGAPFFFPSPIYKGASWPTAGDAHTPRRPNANSKHYSSPSHSLCSSSSSSIPSPRSLFLSLSISWMFREEGKKYIIKIKSRLERKKKQVIDRWPMSREMAVRNCLHSAVAAVHLVNIYKICRQTC